jgi:hypothetical protein
MSTELKLGPELYTPRTPFVAATHSEDIRGKLYTPSSIASVNGDIHLEIFPPGNYPIFLRACRSTGLYKDVIGHVNYTSLPRLGDLGHGNTSDFAEPVPSHYISVRTLNGNISLLIMDPDAIVDEIRSPKKTITKFPNDYIPRSYKRRISADSENGTISINYFTPHQKIKPMASKALMTDIFDIGRKVAGRIHLF